MAEPVIIPSVAQQIYRWLGSPPVPGAGPVRGACWLCGGTDVLLGLPLKKAIPAGFSDGELVRCPASDHLCVACRMLMAGRPPDSWRMASHYVDHTGRHDILRRRADIRAALLGPKSPPFVLAVAVSKQKHVIIRALVAEHDQCFPVQLEHETVWVELPRLQGLLEVFEPALQYHSRTALCTGRYRTAAVKKHGAAAVAALDALLRPYRGTGLLRLAAHVAAKPEGGA